MDHVTLLLVSSLLSQAPALSPAQRDSMERGGTVVSARQLEGSPWPAVTVFVLVDAAPEEVTATFVDYARHATYITGVKRSRISRIVDPVTTEVDYEIDVPLVSDECYTMRDRLSAVGENGYRVDWTLVRATSTKAAVGHVIFIPYTNRRTGKAGTLLEYHDFVTPGSRIAGVWMIRNRAIRRMEETARDIAGYAETERRKARVMAERIGALQRALAASDTSPYRRPR